MKTATVALFLNLIATSFLSSPSFAENPNPSSNDGAWAFDSTPSDRAAFIERANLELARWDQRIAELNAQSQSPAQARKNTTQSVASVLDQIALSAHAELDRMDPSEGWVKQRDSLENKFHRLQDEYKKVSGLAE